MPDRQHLKPIHLYAAEIFKYCFANYRNHLGIGHLRFEKLMPDEAKLLLQAVKENWVIARVAQSLSVDIHN